MLTSTEAWHPKGRSWEDGGECLAIEKTEGTEEEFMDEWLRLAVRPSVMRRAVKFACVVGLVLISINHGYAILHGQVTSGRVWQMCLTVLVPYTVSTLSSVGAMREMEKRRVTGETPVVRN